MSIMQLLVRAKSSRRVISSELPVSVAYFRRETMPVPTFNVDLFNAIWTVLFWFIAKKQEREKFWQAVRIVVEKARSSDESDPNFTLAIMLFGGIITHSIKKATSSNEKSKSEHAYVKNIFDLDPLTINDLMAAIDGTHYLEWKVSVSEAKGGNKRGARQRVASSSVALASAGDSGRALKDAFRGHFEHLHARWKKNVKKIRTFFTDMDKISLVADLRESAGTPNQAELLEQFPDDNSKENLYFCFLVWLRAFVNRIHSICFIQRKESREALQRYRVLRNDPHYARPPFPSNADACEIALGIYEMLREWSVSTLEQWHRFSMMSVQVLSLQNKMDSYTQMVRDVAAMSTDMVVSQLRDEIDYMRARWSEDLRFYRNAMANQRTDVREERNALVKGLEASVLENKEHRDTLEKSQDALLLEHKREREVLVLLLVLTWIFFMGLQSFSSLISSSS